MCGPNIFCTDDQETLKGLDFCFAYLDDIIIYSRTEKEQFDHIKQIFDRLHKANIKLKLTK